MEFMRGNVFSKMFLLFTQNCQNSWQRRRWTKKKTIVSHWNFHWIFCFFCSVSVFIAIFFVLLNENKKGEKLHAESFREISLLMRYMWSMNYDDSIQYFINIRMNDETYRNFLFGRVPSSFITMWCDCVQK